MPISLKLLALCGGIPPTISTHALTWSATGGRRWRTRRKQISTHALTWSATELCDLSAMIRYISTHALTWSATACLLGNLSGYAISTHALTWSATTEHVRQFGRMLNFNSRTHVECDCAAVARRNVPMQFQLTHSRGVRHHTKRKRRNTEHISTHALTWSATSNKGAKINKHKNFNSRTHVECDQNSIPRSHPYNLFQLTHSRGVRPFFIC